MADRTGLFVAPLPGTPPVGTSPTDGRLVLGALFGTGGARVSGGGFTASGTAMQVTVAAAVWRIPDPTNSAGVYLAPADAALLTFSAGPPSGSRIDVLWVRQNNYEAGDANSRVIYGLAAGTAASTPTEPAIPAGAMKIATITVPTNAGNAAACTITPAFPVKGWTSYTPGLAGMPLNTTITASYRTVGSDVEVQAKFTATQTGGSGQLAFSLPFPFAAGAIVRQLQAKLHQPYTKAWPLWVLAQDEYSVSNTVNLVSLDASGPTTFLGPANNGTPKAWAAGDWVDVALAYTPA